MSGVGSRRFIKSSLFNKVDAINISQEHGRHE